MPPRSLPESLQPKGGSAQFRKASQEEPQEMRRTHCRTREASPGDGEKASRRPEEDRAQEKRTTDLVLAKLERQLPLRKQDSTNSSKPLP